MLYATLRDERAIDFLKSTAAKPGDRFDRAVGGYVIEPDSGTPVRVEGRIVFNAVPEGPARKFGHVAIIEFGRGNWLVLTGQRVQIDSPGKCALDRSIRIVLRRGC